MDAKQVLILFLSTILGISIPCIALAGTCKAEVYTTKGSAVLLDNNQAQASQRAVQMAGMAAVDLALKQIALDSMLSTFHLSGNTMPLIPFIKLESAEILQESISRPKQVDDPQIYSVEMKTTLCSISIDPKPDFKLTVGLNKPAFTEGDEMQIELRSNYDCQYAIYFITEDQGVLRLIPSQAKENNVLKAGETVSFPSEKDKQRGIHLRAHVAESGRATTETLFALALRETSIKTTEAMDEAIYGLYDGDTAGLQELIRQVAAIPLDHRSEYIVRYMVQPKKKG